MENDNNALNESEKKIEAKREIPKEYEEVLKYYDPYEFVDWFINKNISKNVQLKVYKNLIKFLLEKLKYYGIDPFLLYEKHNFFGEEYKEKYIEFLDYIGYYKSIKNKIDKTVNKEENKEEDNLVIIDIQQKKNNKEKNIDINKKKKEEDIVISIEEDKKDIIMKETESLAEKTKADYSDEIENAKSSMKIYGDKENNKINKIKNEKLLSKKRIRESNKTEFDYNKIAQYYVLTYSKFCNRVTLLEKIKKLKFGKLRNKVRKIFNAFVVEKLDKNIVYVHYSDKFHYSDISFNLEGHECNIDCDKFGYENLIGELIDEKIIAYPEDFERGLETLKNKGMLNKTTVKDLISNNRVLSNGYLRIKKDSIQFTNDKLIKPKDFKRKYYFLSLDPDSKPIEIIKKITKQDNLKIYTINNLIDYSDYKGQDIIILNIPDVIDNDLFNCICKFIYLKDGELDYIKSDLILCSYFEYLFMVSFKKFDEIICPSTQNFMAHLKSNVEIVDAILDNKEQKIINNNIKKEKNNNDL